jgi:hypothetical protein
MPAGVYYRYSADSGKHWSDPEPLYQTIYFRLLAAEDAYVDMALGTDGAVHVTWDDPRSETSFYAHSTEEAGWTEPQPIQWDLEGTFSQISRVRLVAGPEGQLLRLWQDERMAGCVLYQQASTDAGSWSQPRRVLADLRTCEDPDFSRLADGRALLVAGEGGGSLSLAAWDGTAWTAPKAIWFRFDHPELDRQVSLDGLRLITADDRFMVVGAGQDGDIWFTQAEVEVVEWVEAPASPWREPVLLGDVEGWAKVPALVADDAGRVHAVWTVASDPEGPGQSLYYGRWEAEATGFGGDRAARIWNGQAGEPSLVLVEDQLHLVWSGGRAGEILYMRAGVDEAYGAGGWSEAVNLPAPSAVGDAPQILADPYGMLHVVYAVPLNEGRGIYYTHSTDGGETWAEESQVFDAVAAEWPAVGHPTIAVDEAGVIIVAWVRAALPGSGSPLGIYTAYSTDQGERWSGAMLAKDGAYDWPHLVATYRYQVHLLWNEVGDNRGWWQGWSTDGGQRWTRPARVQGFRQVPGPAGVVSDKAGALHLVGLGQDDVGDPALLYLRWDGNRWSNREVVRVSLDQGHVPGAGAALAPALGQLHAAFLGPVMLEAEDQADAEMGRGVYLTGRPVAEVALTPAPTLTPLPTSTVEPEPTPTPTLRGDIGLATDLPSGGPQDIPLPVVWAGLGALALVAVVFATRPLWIGRR